MFNETEYLTWANRWFPKARINLAKGGMASVDLASLGQRSPSEPAPLRESIAAFNTTSPDRVLPTLGVTHALWMAFALHLRPGDEVLVESPCYEPMWRIPEGLGAKVRFFDRRDAAEGSVFKALQAQRMAGARLIVLSHLHNPSGARLSRSEQFAIAEHCRKHETTLLIDEVYAPYGDALSPEGAWNGSACDLGDHVVAVSGLSKAFGLGAIRAGWLLASPKVIARAESFIQSTLGEMPAAQCALAARAFPHLRELERRREAHLALGGLATVDAWVSQHDALSWHRPENAPFGLVWVRGAGCLRERLEHCARQTGVLVAPGAFFRAPNAFRVGWSVDSEQLAEGLEALAIALEL